MYLSLYENDVIWSTKNFDAANIPVLVGACLSGSFGCVSDSGSQEVVALIPAGFGNILSWRLIIFSTVILYLQLIQEGQFISLC